MPAQVSAGDQQAFWQRLGVPLRKETEGRVYPAALQASVVTGALLLRQKQLHVELATDARVVSMRKSSDCFVLSCLKWEWCA